MTRHELASRENGFGQVRSIYKINWPRQVTEADVASLAAYRQGGDTADVATALVILRQADQLMDVCLARARERYQRIPEGVTQVVGPIFGNYTRPARTLLEARKIEAWGVQMPPLLAPEIAEYLETCRQNSPKAVAWVEQGLIEGNLEIWEAESNLLRLLKEKGPLGVVDHEADKSLSEAVILGRERFHVLYQAAQAL